MCVLLLMSETETIDSELYVELKKWSLDAIYNMTSRVLKEMDLSVDKQTLIFNKLKYYRFINGAEELINGSHICYMSLGNIEEQMHDHKETIIKSSIFCKINDNNAKNDGRNWLICKNYGFKVRHFQICFEDNLVFQKFNKDELLMIESAELLL